MSRALTIGLIAGVVVLFGAGLAIGSSGSDSGGSEPGSAKLKAAPSGDGTQPVADVKAVADVPPLKVPAPVVTPTSSSSSTTTPSTSTYTAPAPTYTAPAPTYTAPPPSSSPPPTIINPP